MTIIKRPYSQSQPLARRRLYAALLAASTLLAQLFLPSITPEASQTWTGILPLLTLPVAAYCHHALLSDAWVWNRLFRRKAQLDEYEVHARNAFIARAYTQKNPLLLASFAAFLIGGGLLNNAPGINVFSGANVEAAVTLFLLVTITLTDALPRVVAALSEVDPEA